MEGSAADPFTGSQQPQQGRIGNELLEGQWRIERFAQIADRMKLTGSVVRADGRLSAPAEWSKPAEVSISRLDDGIISSTGPGTGVEVAFELLELLTSKANAMHIRTLMRIMPRSQARQQTPQVPVEI